MSSLKKTKNGVVEGMIYAHKWHKSTISRALLIIYGIIYACKLSKQNILHAGHGPHFVMVIFYKGISRCIPKLKHINTVKVLEINCYRQVVDYLIYGHAQIIAICSFHGLRSFQYYKAQMIWYCPNISQSMNDICFRSS